MKSIKLNQKKKEFYLTDLIEFFVKNEQKVDTLETEDPDECLGINSKNDLAKAFSL